MSNLPRYQRKTMQMHQLVEWFQLNFPKHHQALIQCNHNFDQEDLNPYHLESDCWSHTMLVCKVAELSGYDKVVQVSALLHDIGKPESRKVNPRNDHVQFFGHEEISASMSESVLKQMEEEGIIDEHEVSEVYELIMKHSVLHKLNDPHELFNRFKNKKEFYIHLVQLNRCDALGRFCADNGFSDEKYERLISYSKNMQEMKR